MMCVNQELIQNIFNVMSITSEKATNYKLVETQSHIGQVFFLTFDMVGCTCEVDVTPKN
jgi:hypothetical protein